MERQVFEMEQQIDELSRAVTEERDSFRVERLQDENEYLNNQLGSQ